MTVFVCNLDATAVHIEHPRRQQVAIEVDLRLEKTSPSEAV